MNYNPRMGFNEQDYHLLKTHQSSGSKPYKLITVARNTVAQSELIANVDNLNDIVVMLNVPALGSTAGSTELFLTFTGTGLEKQVHQITCSKTDKTTHMITFKNTDGFYELSYSTPATGKIGLDQKGWIAKAFNAEYKDKIGGFTQIPVNKITLAVEGGQQLPVNTIMGVMA